ncbi:LysR family transcriptional regulator [Klenkia sp. LSe6-5]|uniref:LysR family transcriptional regulator n=1 Tax=Klenkia sesuvii TaxID=3103137 RepID=A0ABU8DZD6_9ACTN
MEIRTLRYAVTLADELHFGRAARRHYISAQPFGRHIQRLEREVGARLFDRTSRQVRLTAAGESFVVRARAVLAQVDQLRSVAADVRPVEPGPIRIGILGFGAGDRWRDLAAAVRVQAPGSVLEHHELTFADQYDAVRQGLVDVAVVHHVGELEGLLFEPVLSTPRVAVVPAASPMADATVLTTEELVDCRWLNVAAHEPLLRSWAGPALDPTAPAVRSPAGIPGAVATTGRISLHAADAARYYPHPDVRFIPLIGAGVNIAVATRSDDHRSTVAAFRRAAKLVRKLDLDVPIGDRNRFD